MKPTLVLVPGLLCDSLVWKHQLAAFADTHELLVPELSDYTSLEAMAAAVLAVAPVRFALAGHSLGGRIALEVVRQEPARVTHLALMDTGVGPPSPAERASRLELVVLGETVGLAAVAERWLPPMLHPARRQEPTFMAPLAAMVTGRTAASFRRQQEALLARPDARPVLAQVHCPTLVLTGREDEWSPPEQHEAIATAIPGASLVIVPEAGHFAPLEQPAAVTQALRELLAR
jgi:pimeloyl-ACP methyl ester carboxylesterase